MKIPALIKIETKNDLNLHLHFEDEISGTIDFDDKDLVGLPVSLKDLTFFQSAKLKKGVIHWPNEIEIHGDSLYLKIKGITFDEWRDKQLVNA